MHETDIEVLQALWLSGNYEMPPEPQSYDVCAVSAFPGAGFETNQPIDYEAINSWAAVYGWKCRFKRADDPYSGPLIYYPEEAS